MIASTISVTPACTSISMMCASCGLFANSMSGFGFESVSGRSCVPRPPTKIKPFMAAAKRRDPSQGVADLEAD